MTPYQRTQYSRVKIISVLLCLFFLSFYTTAAAQELKAITGSILDSTGKGLGGASISFFKKVEPQKAVANAITSDAGRFSVVLKDTGDYVVEVSITGYASRQASVHVGGGAAQDMGSLVMGRPEGNLKNVTVTSTRKVIEHSDDKITYNVENDPSSKGLSTLDLLRKVPFLSIDGNEQVRLNGQSNFRVLLNGRETAMFAQNVSEALQAFPAATIVKVEVITNPSARYDAEGLGGLINIITRKKIQGYNGSLSTWSTTINQHVTSANLNAKFNSIGISVNYGTRSNINIPGFTNIITIPEDGAFYSHRELDGRRRTTYFNHYGNGELSWSIDTLNTLSFYGNVSGGFSRQTFNLDTRTDLSSGPIVTSHFDQFNRRQFPTNTIGADFIKKYPGNTDKEFSLRMNAELGQNDSYLESTEYTSAYTRYIINNSDAVNRQYTLQADYILPLPKGLKLEAGARATLRRASSDFESQLKYGETESYKVNPSNTDNFRFYQDIYSAYGSYSFKTGKYSLRTGLRVEHTTVNGDFKSSRGFSQNTYTNILPNLQISRRIKDLSLVLSYTQRLQRPSIAYLNPFIESNDSLNLSYGNPALDAQSIHTVSLQSRLQKGKTFMGLTFSGSYSNNMIVTLISFDNASGVRSSTYQNAGRDLLLSVNGSVNAPLGEKWTGNANVNFMYRVLKNMKMPGMWNNGIAGNTSLGATFTPNTRLSITNYIGFEQAIIDLQSKPNTIPFCGSGVNFQLVPNKLRLGLMAQNYFAKYYNYKTVVTTEDFESVQSNRSLMGKMVFTALWNFGKLKEQVSKKKGVTNDDTLTVQ
jgi:hypothetical protein